ncbi:MULTISPECIES: alpha/beta fold hydrolase [unclassified Arthrobacter]|uniref:alpha/beta fold hydrolase n=1 Tax=unclassified Arthrobacter TaxID=235627 RepID=UPI003FA394D7
MRLLDAVSPYIAARLAAVLFWHLGRPSSVRAVEREVHESAAVEQVVFGRTAVTVYTWGTGNSVILLVHGWRSRASRFSHLVKALVRDGHMLVSFDAPGHGASGKGPSNVVEWAGIIRELEARYGHFDAVVGHSFGVLAAFHAVRMGVTTGRMVTIAGVHSLEHLVTSFTQVIRLPTRARERFRARINQLVFVDSAFEWGQIVSQLDSDSSCHFPKSSARNVQSRLHGRSPCPAWGSFSGHRLGSPRYSMTAFLNGRSLWRKITWRARASM